MRIVVGGIIHYRATIQQHLRSVLALDNGKHELKHAWVVDNSPEVVRLLEGDADAIVDARIPGDRYKREQLPASRRRPIYARLAALRNMLAEVAISLGADALLSIDSDIVVPKHLLVKLADVDVDWVAALVRNGAEPTIYNVFKLVNNHVKRFAPIVYEGGFQRPTSAVWYDPQDEGKKPCLAAGAVCMYSRRLLESARWSTDGRGCQEDVGFARNAHAEGFSAWYVPVICRHLTVGGADGN